MLRTCVAACLLPSVLPAADYIWIEGETPTQNPLHLEAAGVERSQYLSDSKWLKLMIGENEVGRKVPAEGALVGYEFDAPKAGAYQIWGRIGMQSIRSAFDWRIDEQPWRTIPVDAPYTDLMDPGVWNEIEWIRLGDAELTAGKHALQFRLMPSFKEEKQKGADGKETIEKKPQRMVFCPDCFCLSLGEFRPHGKYKPDADWMTDDDKKAAAQVFELKPGGKGDDRITLPLAGLWQVGRYDEFEVADRCGPDKSLPDRASVYWRSIPIPSDKYKSLPEFTFAHRLVYRTRVASPAEMNGRSFFLHFPGNNMISSVFVNGQFCGWTKAMLAPWDCDVSAAMKPGGENEIAVVIKDTYYAISPQKMKTNSKVLSLHPYSVLRQNWVGQFMDFPVNSVPESGILETPSLVACGGVYAADVFAKPSVKRKELGLELTLKNPGPAVVDVKVEVALEPLGGGPAEKTFAANTATVGAGQELALNLAEPWENPKLWWPDDPRQYEVVTRISAAGRPTDVRRTKFGFREWEWNSSQFKLNGIPWHGRSDTTTPKTMDACLKLWRDHNQTVMRFWGDNWCGLKRSAALDVLDREGMVVRISGIFDGEGANYLHGLSDPVLFDNWATHLEQFVKAYRNHPSILIWSIENEITFINSRNLGQAKTVEPLVAKAAKRAMEVDPTRPVMVDGGRCLIAEDLPVNGCHYEEAEWREYPQEAYTLERLYKSHEVENAIGWDGIIPWRLVPDRPIFMGESFYLRGERPVSFAQFGGEGCVLGWQAARPGAGLFAKILSEGYRWHGVAAFMFSLTDDGVSDIYNCWKPVCALCREWNWTFAGGSKVARTLKVLNDTHYADPIEFAWEYRLDGKPVGGEKKVLTIPPGEGQELKITLDVPAVKDRTRAQFILTCSRDGKEVFRDEKESSVISPDNGPRPAFKAGELAVVDPGGTVKARLQKNGIAFTELNITDDVPMAVRVLIVGPDAIDLRQATDTKWKGVAARGGRVLVLDQANPLRFSAIPADLEVTPYAGRIAFAENLRHPAFQGLDQPDFFTWTHDALVYRNVYRKASRGAKSLAHCDKDLGFCCLAECEVNEGLMLLCQMEVGTKLASDPVAQRLFDNLLACTASYQPTRKPAALVFDETSPRGKLLAESGLQYELAGGVLEVLKAGKAQIVVADATPENLHALAAIPDVVKAYTEKGGWLFLWGLTPEGLQDFNKLVGVEHLIRPFIRERVMFPMQRDPLVSGLTLRDIVMESGQQIAFYAGRYMASDAFSYVVDYDNVAPFLKFPDWRQFNPGKDKPDPDKDPYNLVDGFVGSDDWRYIFQIPIKPEFMEWDMELPREETPTEIMIIPNGYYKLLTRIELTYDGDTEHPIPLTFEPKNTEQSFTLPERKAKKIHLKIVSWEEKQAASCVGIDDMWIKVKRSPEFYEKVKPLLNISALVKYPQGLGGVILCEVNVPAQEQLAENAQKKRNIVSTLLRNLGAVLSGGKILVAGAGLSYEPIMLNDACNQFLTKDKDWFTNEAHDLSQFPVGEQKLAGVTYRVRDFKTSPLPCAIALAGPGLKDKPVKVTGIKVGQKADALFFLHTLHRSKGWNPPREGDKTPPVVFKYVIHYADGSQADAPVRYGEGVDHWIEKNPLGIRNAVVAWSSPLGNDKSGDQATVYQMQWANAKPGVEISTIDLVYDEKVQNAYGAPVLLGISAATEVAK